MKINIHYSICFVLLVMAISCLALGFTACSKKGMTSSKPTSYFVIGSGGGISGKYIQYKVFENGNVQLFDFDAQKYIPYSTLSTSLNETIWTQLEALDLLQYNLDQPGNYNYYIEIENASDRHRVRWSDEFERTPKALRHFFNATDNALRETK